MFHEIIFPRFGVPRMVISDGGTHFTDRKFHAYLRNHGISKSRIFYRRWLMDGKCMERSTTRGTLGLSYGLQDTIGYVTISVGIWKDLPSTS
jgi:hypothetical protein